jgi:hypothetical protein
MMSETNLSSHIPDTRPVPATATAPTAAELEYRNLREYFERLVKYTSLALSAIVVVGSFFLWKDISGARDQATAAISATKSSADREISGIKTEASVIAREEARKKVDEAFERENIQQLIENTARERVGKAVDREIATNLSIRIQELQNQIEEIGEISNQGARLRLEFRPALDILVKKTESRNRAVSEYAKSTLDLVGSDYESFIKLHFWNPEGDAIKEISKLGSPGPRTPKEFMEIIRHSEYLNNVVLAFLAMRQVTGEPFKVYDIPSVEKWCSAHKPRCE